MAAKLVNKNTQKLLGWLYLDEHGSQYIGLAANVDPQTYHWFGMEKSNMHKAGVPTEAVPQPNLRLPPWAEIQRC